MHNSVLPEWVVERGKWLNAFRAIEPARTALVIIDMQEAFVTPGAVFGNPHAVDIVPKVNELATAMRAAGGKVIWTRQTVSESPPLAMAAWQYDPDDPRVKEALAALSPGAVAHGLHPYMDFRQGDLLLDKYRYSAFACPDGALEQSLQERGIDMLVIAGTLTNVCCEGTAREAYMRGYKVICVSDAMAAVTDAEHNASLMNLRINFADVHPTRAVLAMLEDAKDRKES